MSPRIRAGLIGAAVVVLACSSAVTGTALAHHAGKSAERSAAVDRAPWVSDGLLTGAATTFTGPSTFASGGQHGLSRDHLPAVRENIELIGKLTVDTPAAYRYNPATGASDPSQPAVVPGQIADVSVYKDAAYLASWSEPSCRRGGFFSVDISDPANPRQLAFVPALPGTYHGEGTHTITLNTPSFSGDVLAVNNEPCGANGVGGFDLYDVSNPAQPKTLVQGAGDQSPDDTSETQNPAEVPNSAHSVFIWQRGAKAYAVIVDNTELHDVDIFDITDPRSPQFIGDHDLIELADEQGVDIIDNSANGDAIFHHDMIVKEIGGVPIMLVSYWDAGYVKVNVADPANPLIIGDSAFDDEDPLVIDPGTGRGHARPEGNGHQSEFSHDNKYVLAADEDFSTYRLPRFAITTGPNTGLYAAGEFGFTRPMSSLDDNTLDGPTVYGGYGCTADNDIPAAPGGVTLGADEEAILVLQRGPESPTADPSAPYPACTFQEKADNAAAAGWDAVIIGNHHAGSGGGAQPDAALCGSGTFADIIAVCVGHRAMHLLFNQTPGYGGYPGGHMPAIGATGQKIQTASLFDGWGYTHLYRNDGDDLTAVDHFAIEEATDERYAFGFGDLTVHEFATDPQVNLVYSSYYAGGVRVLSFGDDGLKQVGKFIDDGGNNFWGVEQFTSQGQRLVAASDRDSGLYIVKYTGPGAPPVATSQPTTGGPGTTTPTTQPVVRAAGKDTTKARLSLLSSRRQSLRTLRGRGLSFRIGSDEQVKLEVTLRGRFTGENGGRGKVQRLAKVTVASVAGGKVATVTLRPSASLRKRLADEKQLPATIALKATDAAGNVTTRTKMLTFR